MHKEYIFIDTEFQKKAHKLKNVWSSIIKICCIGLEGKFIDINGLIYCFLINDT
jgi:hypothetical protein